SRGTIDRALADVCQLFFEIPGVERIRFGVNNAPDYRHAMLAIELTDETALHRFGRRPEHARAIRLINRLAESSSVGSFLIRSEQM
ncbi:MAG TPA: hypothetical protein VKQ36_05105, partial [Ktedonobacterales bacterium]|nr:hypothetical protein [Ktedonobacterales bacterium]